MTQAKKGCSAWFIVLGSGLQQVITGPRSLFSSFYKDSAFLSIFAVPNNAAFWITSNLTFKPICFMYSLKLTDTAPRTPIKTGTTTTFLMCQTFTVSSFNSWYFFSQFLYLSSCHHGPWWQHQLLQPNSPSYQERQYPFWSSYFNFPIILDCKIPQYLEVFTLHHSLWLLFIAAISSFQFTLITKLQVEILFHVIMPSLYSVCASLLHSLTTWVTVSPLLLYIMHKGNSAVWSIWSFI